MSAEYVTAVYLRISDDDGRYGDSQSIEGQRDLIRDFIRSHPELKSSRIAEYTDDGYSGTNFKRPGVSELLQRARRGDIQCIVVKDFSRFGRNYIEVGDYLEQILPFLRVRFISVNDAYDSETQGGSAGDVNVAFKHLCNDYYSKDLSRKIKAGIHTKWEAGICRSPQLPLGYVKSSDKVLVDDKAAEIIRYIFRLAADGNGTTEIARILNAEDVPTPMQYKYENGLVKSTVKQPERYVWTNTTVYVILTDITYTGHLIQGRWRCIAVGSRRNRRAPREQWYVTPDHHEPIISKEDFERAAHSIASRGDIGGKKPRKPSSPLSGKLRCGGCGHTLKKCGTKEPSYACGYKKYVEDHSCLTGRIKVSEVEDVLLASLQNLFNTFNARKEARRLQAENRRSASVDLMRQVQAVQRQIASGKSDKLTLYNRYSEGEISKDEYFRKRESIEATQRDLSEQAAELERRRMEASPFASELSEFDNLAFDGQLTRELMDALVESILVYDGGRIEIKWKFTDEAGAILSGEIGGC